MTIIATIDFTFGLVGLLAAFLAVGMSSAPGSRSLRWFGVCAGTAASYILANVVVTLPVDTRTLAWGSRIAGLFVSLHVAAWFAYLASRSGRRLHAWERAFVALALLFGVCDLVPGLIISDTLLARPVPSLGVTYRDAVPTTFGELTLAFHIAGLTTVFARFVVRAIRRIPGAITHSTALGFILVGAIHDALAFSGVIYGPYVLEVSMFAMVIAVGGSLASQFVATSRALEQSARDLARAQTDLLERERLAAVGELAAVVAHEIRNPLAVVFNAVATLPKLPADSAEHASLLRIVREEAERLRDIVSALLDFARPKAPAFARVAFRQLVENAVDASRRGTDPIPEVLVEVGDLVDEEIECDAQLVHQAIVNLVTNAIQAPGRNSAVRVSIGATSAPDMVEVSIADDGDGIPEAARHKIFAPFYSTRATGSGLGLAVVKRCADVHGGHVHVRETLGGGATLTLRLPKTRPDPARSRAK